VQVRDGEAMEDAVQQISTVLRLRHRITGEDDFTVSSQQEVIEALEETTNTFVVFLGSIASISLLVGGIGIMNIMLVSVTERTREIGIRKAMGAKRGDILLQFVSEATLLSLGGGGIGVLLGLALSQLLDGRSLAGQSFQTVFSGNVALLALVVSAAIGLFFGIYPAIRAARLHPIDALRHE
jgi:putative ABC transport system permease protein